MAILLAHPDTALARQQKHTSSHPSRPSSKAKPAKTKTPPTSKRPVQSSPQKAVEPVAFPVHAAPKIPARSDLDGDDRINELRNWLHQRNAERDNKLEPDRYESDFLSAEPAPLSKEPLRRKPLDLKYTLPVDDDFEDHGSVLHIGRSPDGRVYHRYILKDSDSEALRRDNPEDEMDTKNQADNIPAQRSGSRLRNRTGSSIHSTAPQIRVKKKISRPNQTAGKKPR
ncbi:MAG: hypothetical protein ACR2HF_02175 [Methylococcaceae bacterium]